MKSTMRSERRIQTLAVPVHLLLGGLVLGMLRQYYAFIHNRPGGFGAVNGPGLTNQQDFNEKHGPGGLFETVEAAVIGPQAVAEWPEEGTPTRPDVSTWYALCRGKALPAWDYDTGQIRIDAHGTCEPPGREKPHFIAQTNDEFEVEHRLLAMDEKDRVYRLGTTRGMDKSVLFSQEAYERAKEWNFVRPDKYDHEPRAIPHYKLNPLDDTELPFADQVGDLLADLLLEHFYVLDLSDKIIDALSAGCDAVEAGGREHLVNRFWNAYSNTIRPPRKLNPRMLALRSRA